MIADIIKQRRVESRVVASIPSFKQTRARLPRVKAESVHGESNSAPISLFYSSTLPLSPRFFFCLLSSSMLADK